MISPTREVMVAVAHARQAVASIMRLIDGTQEGHETMLRMAAVVIGKVCHMTGRPLPEILAYVEQYVREFDELAADSFSKSDD